MSQIVFTTCLALFVCLAFVQPELVVENGNYGNVLVSFSQNVPSNKGVLLLEKLQHHLGETAELLRNAVGLGISDVTFVIPRSWDTSEWNITVESQSLSERDIKADILVDEAEDRAFGNFPFAQQYGSCGTPGSRIVVSSAFLTEQEAFPGGTLLAREWLKYRYGVFDENGYPGDELYPSYYNVPGSDPTDWIVTGCTNTPVVYNFTDNNGETCTPSIGRESRGECRAKPEKETLKNVTSSLMYFHQQIPDMKHVCGKEAAHKHSSRSRNKHNSLCREQSVWDVINTSSDFKSSTSEIASEETINIQFKYVQEPNPRVVIAFEDVASLKKQENPVLYAVRKFHYDLPKGSKYCLFPYDENIDANIDYSLRELNNWPEDWRIDQLQSEFISPEDGCVTCAISKALEILATDDTKPQGTAVIIASSNPTVDEDLLKRLRESEVCLVLLVLSDDATLDEYKKYADASPCGALFEISMADNNEEVFKKLFEAMESILPETLDDTFTETVKTEQSKGGSPITFSVDETMGSVTIWILREKFPITNIKYVSAQVNGRIIALKDEKTSGMTAVSFVPNESGDVELILLYDIEALIQVRAKSKPGNYVSGEVIFYNTTKEGQKQQMPIILYTRVYFGPYPVQNAEVSAEISRPDGNVIKLTMYDDGLGDPDITANDGVYSRYFVKFSDKGEYKVTVTVKNENDARAGKLNERGGYQPCCGSKIEMGTYKLPSFTKKFETTFNAISGRPDGGYQPSRIVDLRVENVTDDKVVLKWTAPGGDADHGKASRYEMKLFCREGENAIDCHQYKMVRISNKPPPMNYGSKQKVTVQILNTSQTLSIGIAAFNENNQESDLSNTIEILRPVDNIEEITTTPEYLKDEAQINTGIIIGSCIASFIVLLSIVIGIVCFCKRRQSNSIKFKEGNTDLNENRNSTYVQNAFKATNYSTTESPVRKVESFPVLLYTHDQLKDFKRKDKDPSLYKDDIPPKPWVSLNVLSSLRTMDNDARSLGSSSTVHIRDSTESNKTN